LAISQLNAVASAMRNLLPTGIAPPTILNFNAANVPIADLNPDGTSGRIRGVLWTLVLTYTTLNVESLMGAIMAVGVATTNGNLLITFANEHMEKEGVDPLTAAIEAGTTRLRPVIMTALAMILGMLPMSLALGSGGEQDAPLGRAVIGGLIAATFVTLLVIPIVF
jgi:multidrug efflux pump subunit AcrB